VGAKAEQLVNEKVPIVVEKTLGGVLEKCEHTLNDVLARKVLWEHTRIWPELCYFKP
jgi:hypothetical protein